MDMVEILGKEHRIFLAILDRMEREDRDLSDAAARAQLRDALRVMLPALSEHERLEELIFGHPLHVHRKPIRKLLDNVAAEHADLEVLKTRLSKALACWGEPPEGDLKVLVFELCERLRRHFRTEESQLWPFYRLGLGRTRETDAARQALKHLRALEHEARQSGILSGAAAV